jgi:hypothetical protein
VVIDDAEDIERELKLSNNPEILSGAKPIRKNLVPIGWENWGPGYHLAARLKRSLVSEYNRGVCSYLQPTDD